MTELILKDNIDRQKLDSIIFFLNSLNVETEIKSTDTVKETDSNELFAETFGMWANRDINIKEIRQKVNERRTKKYNNGAF